MSDGGPPPGADRATAAAPGLPAIPRARGLRAVAATLSMIKFQHTFFALPFAFTGALLAAGGLPSGRVLGWILGAMVGARSAAMVFNRIADLELDRRNPRTIGRPLVTGELSLGFAWSALAAGVTLFLVSAAMLNRLALILAPPALALILSYSYAKRLTWLTHLHLGASLGLAPLGAWVAVRGDLAPAPFLLAGAVMLWVAGFDVLYACQDVEFDHRHGLRSIPARFGIPRSLAISSALHAATVVLLVALPLSAPGLGVAFLLGVAGTAALLAYEHRLVRPGDLSRVNQAFFQVNGCVSFLILGVCAIDLLA